MIQHMFQMPLKRKNVFFLQLLINSALSNCFVGPNNSAAAMATSGGRLQCALVPLVATLVASDGCIYIYIHIYI